MCIPEDPGSALISGKDIQVVSILTLEHRGLLSNACVLPSNLRHPTIKSADTNTGGGRGSEGSVAYVSALRIDIK